MSCSSYCKRLASLQGQGKWSLLIKKGVKLDETIKFIPTRDGVYLDEQLFKRVRSSSNARVYLSSCLCGNSNIPVYIIRYLFRSRLDFFKHLFRSSRTKRAFRASLMLAENRFHAPQPVALLQKKQGLFLTQSILATESAEGFGQTNHFFAPKYGDHVRMAANFR